MAPNIENIESPVKEATFKPIFKIKNINNIYVFDLS
jgi:hypothetical protein